MSRNGHGLSCDKRCGSLRARTGVHAHLTKLPDVVTMAFAAHAAAGDHAGGCGPRAPAARRLPGRQGRAGSRGHERHQRQGRPAEFYLILGLIKTHL